MARSMTGFGRGEASGDIGRIIVEMKAINHRFSEVVFRMPRQFGALEEAARKLIQGRLSRGRIDVFVSWEATARDRGVKVDKVLAMAYYNALKELEAEIQSKSEHLLDALLKLPDVISVEEGQVTANELQPVFESALTQSLEQLLLMREREGATLTVDLASRIDTIESLAHEVGIRAPQVVEEYRGRLERRLEELLSPHNPVEPQRLAQEVAIFADRADITEELQRLTSHLAQFRQALASEEPVGRKLDFLVQEIGREINTVGSKANDGAIATLVIEAKSEMEKIREQVQNLE